MNSRRRVLAIATAFLLRLQARAQAPISSPIKELARHELTSPHAGLEVVLVEVTAIAGVPSTAHRHPGFVLGYVLNGEMEFAVNGEKHQVVKAGGTFFEPSGSLHTTGTSAKPDLPVQFLAFMVVPKGNPLVLPA